MRVALSDAKYALEKEFMMISMIFFLIGMLANIAIPIRGERNTLGVLITTLRHSKYLKLLTIQLWRDDFENRYLDRMWERMQSYKRTKDQ